MISLKGTLFVCIILLATTSYAQDNSEVTAGSEGDGVVDGDLLPPPVNLESVRVIPPLKVTSQDDVRSLPDDSGALIRGFGAITKKQGGPESVREAPDGVKRAIEAADDVEPNFMNWKLEPDPLMEADKAVIGRDDRKRVTTNSAYPFRAIGWLYIQTGNTEGSCSGALIGPRTVLTAAHCVYNHDAGGWVDSVTFYPGANGESFPYPGYEVDEYTILRGFVENFDTRYGSVIPWDLAVLTLPRKAGDRVGTLGFEANNQQSFIANLVGYPADKDLATMWRVSCEIDAARMAPETFRHECDTYGGSSGSSMYRYDKTTDKRYVNGVNVAENVQGKYNIGVLLNSVYKEWVANLRQ